jgi:hypothetical protein
MELIDLEAKNSDGSNTFAGRLEFNRKSLQIGSALLSRPGSPCFTASVISIFSPNLLRFNRCQACAIRV